MQQDLHNASCSVAARAPKRVLSDVQQLPENIKFRAEQFQDCIYIVHKAVFSRNNCRVKGSLMHSWDMSVLLFLEDKMVPDNI